jgi:hypothetical protein
MVNGTVPLVDVAVNFATGGCGRTVINPVWVVMFDPPAFVAFKVTVYVPGLVY